MIHWLVQSLADHPDLERGTPPPGLLSPAESARLAELRVAKRRRDWLLGRWTAKHLLQSTLSEELGVRLPLNAYTIETDTTGAPLPAFDLSWTMAGGRAGPGDGAGAGGRSRGAFNRAEALGRSDALSLSISHSGDHAFCALSLMECARVGADIELISEKTPEFVEQYFTPAECAAVAAAPEGRQVMAATLIWSAKESALKALHLGLRVDTRLVECPIALLGDDESGMAPLGYQWSRFQIRLDPTLWEMAGLTCSDHPLQVAGWWQIMSNYALTMVLIS
jgi:4'-phosphopantetheinyl transferase